MSPVVRIDPIVNRILRLLGMELARLAVQTHTTVVVDTVGNIGSLLNLSKIASASDSVYSPRRKEEHISGSHFVVGKDGHYFSLLNQLHVLLRINLLL